MGRLLKLRHDWQCTTLSTPQQPLSTAKQPVSTPQLQAVLQSYVWTVKIQDTGMPHNAMVKMQHMGIHGSHATACHRHCHEASVCLQGDIVCVWLYGFAHLLSVIFWMCVLSVWIFAIMDMFCAGNKHELYYMADG